MLQPLVSLHRRCLCHGPTLDCICPGFHHTEIPIATPAVITAGPSPSFIQSGSILAENGKQPVVVGTDYWGHTTSNCPVAPVCDAHDPLQRRCIKWSCPARGYPPRDLRDAKSEVTEEKKENLDHKDRSEAAPPLMIPPSHDSSTETTATKKSKRDDWNPFCDPHPDGFGHRNGHKGSRADLARETSRAKRCCPCDKTWSAECEDPCPTEAFTLQ